MHSPIWSRKSRLGRFCFSRTLHILIMIIVNR